MKRVLISLLIAFPAGIVITPVLLFVMAFSEMAWKTQIVDCVIFPYGTSMNQAIALAHAGESMTLTYINLTLFAIQYPFYAIVIGVGNVSRRSGLIAALSLLAVHAIAAIASLAYYFWR